MPPAMVSALAVAAMLLLSVVATVLAPRLMAQQHRFRRCPGPALLVWQCVAVAGVSSALVVGPVAAITLVDRPVLIGLASALSLGMLGRLLYAGHTTGTGLRALRARHRDLVDLLGTPGEHRDERVLAQPGPTAYCLPGLRGEHRRIVLSAGTLDRLDREELAALLAHEQAHLRSRHDLVLEFFTVLHRSVPAPARCEPALTEARLLVEALADRSAASRAGPIPLARALVAMQGGAAPGAALGAGGEPDQTRVRLALLADGATPHRWLATGMVAVGVLTALTPLLLALAAVYPS